MGLAPSAYPKLLSRLAPSIAYLLHAVLCEGNILKRLTSDFSLLTVWQKLPSFLLSKKLKSFFSDVAMQGSCTNTSKLAYVRHEYASGIELVGIFQLRFRMATNSGTDCPAIDNGLKRCFTLSNQMRQKKFKECNYRMSGSYSQGITILNSGVSLATVAYMTLNTLFRNIVAYCVKHSLSWMCLDYGYSPRFIRTCSLWRFIDTAFTIKESSYVGYVHGVSIAETGGAV